MKPMDFERRHHERAANREPGDSTSQEALFIALVRSGRINDATEQANLFTVLNQSGRPESAVARMNELFDKYQTGLRCGYVPLETPVAEVPTVVPAASATTAPAPMPEHRFVTWKRVFRIEKNPDGIDYKIEIPGSIEKIMRVKLRKASLEQLIEDGHYDDVNSRIMNEPVPVDEVEEVRELVLPKFDRDITLEEIDTWLEENELLGATLKELLAIGAQFPEGQRLVYMAALDASEGSWRSRGRVPVLYRDVHGRSLGLDDFDGRWDENGRFPASRKPSST